MIGWTHRWFNPEQSDVDADAIGTAYAQLLLSGLGARPVAAERAVGDGKRPARRGPEPTPATTEPHPDVARLVEHFASLNVPTYDTVSALHARALLEGVTRLQGPPQDVAEVRDIPLPGAEGLLPARIYHPDPGRRLPMVVYFHGGGWVLGNIRAADGPCRALAQSSGCVVVSLEYRRAPETKFPGPLEDCLSAVRWLASRVEEPGGIGRVVLLGDSAGGNLAAATSMCLRDAGGPRVDAQVLRYPCLAPARGSTFGSYAQQADGPLLTRAEMTWFWDHYLVAEADGLDPRAAPLLAPDLSGLPPTTVVVCELDPLRDEGLAYAERLQTAGAETDVICYPGAAHGFWWMDGVMRQAGELTAQLGLILRGDTRRNP